MMTMLWVLFVALAGTHSGYGSPVRSTPPAYPHDASGPDWPEDWLSTLAAVAIVASFAGVLTGCIWCFRRKDLGEPNEGADNQLFTASATALHDGQRSQPPDSGFSETAAGEDNNNGPISFREMQNIENNNAAVYIAVETEARARSRESVIEFEPLPVPPAPPSPPPQRPADPLETCADWFGGEDIPRNSLQYLRECSRGWFGRVLEAELETDRGPRTVSAKVLDQAASLEDKARFLREARALRDAPHENLLAYVGKCLQEDPWTLVFEFCPMDLRTYLTGEHSPAPAALSLAADAATALAHLHARGYHGLAGALNSDSILVRDPAGTPRAVLAGHAAPPSAFAAPETTIPPHAHTASSEVWSLGVVVWEALAGGAAPPACPAPPPAAPDPIQDHAYQVMQLCWQPEPASRATASQVAALLRALRSGEASAGGVDFEERWQRLKPNSIPKLDEHIALIHARAPSPPPRSESLTNLHGSLEDVRNIYLTHNETAAVDCHQGNIALEDLRDDISEPVDPWLKDIIAGSQDDVSYYRDVSDVIKNLDNILNSEKTSSSESSHQASPSRDNLSLDCKREYQSQSGLVKSPGISNFQNVLDMGFDAANEVEACEDEDLDQDTLGTLSHSFERHSDSTSQHTLENLTPGTPMNNIEAFENIVSQIEAATENNLNEVQEDLKEKTVMDNECSSHLNDVTELPKENEVDCSVNNIPKLKDLCVASMPSLSEINEQFNVREDCEPTCANNVAETIRTDKEVETKSIDYTTSNINDTVAEEASNTNKTVEVEDMTEKIIEGSGDAHRSDIDKVISDQESNESTMYMDLIDDSNSKVVNEKPLDNNVTTVSDSCQNAPGLDSEVSLLTNESTVYLDLPSAVKDTKDFLQSERMNSSQHIEDQDEFCASTPKGSDRTADNTLEMNTKEKEVDLSETKVADCENAVSVTKLELKQGSENLSPFESPSKSHHTDTYEENSSVVLGPFENCTTDTYRLKTELVNLPKEELLAFSSNFSDIDLETPSPLRDSNFLNEVPDIIPDEFNFEDISERENRLSGDRADPQTDDTEETVDSGTAKHISPSTPPNSPGCFLASTSHQMYAVEVDLDSASGVPPPAPPAETDSGLSSLQKEIDLNQIEMTSNLAMAENENNLNMEYSGPLTVEGVVSEGGDVLPEAYLAGNAGFDAEPTEDCMQALRYELELKLPLAQVSGIEPEPEPAESREEWALPPPPELVVSYCAAPPALSPIAEETGHQLHAYENDKWNTYTDSSESYLEPCNMSTDEATELPTATTVGGPSGDGDGGEGPSRDHSNQETYTLQSRPTDATYTVHQDVPTSNEMTMSADSLNGSPYKRPAGPPAPDDHTYRVDDKEPACERISQVSPFLASPTTDASTPGPASTLTRTTDAKHSKPSECLSKTASIDSWCSNDTLYNVEENFDDLALEPEPPHSEATDTLTHDDRDKDQDASHSSTYIVHDSKSDLCDTFSPDSMNANNNHTYTKGKTDATVTLEAKSDVNDSTKNTQTKDLAYGTLPSYSNCTTELLSSFNDPLRLPRPELVRRSPVADEVDLTPPKMPEAKPIVAMDSPRTDEPSVNKMSSVEITCLRDESVDSQNKSDGSPYREGDIYDSPKYNSNMAPSLTSTPILEPANSEDVPNFDSPEIEMTHIPNYQAFLQSAELRPQGLTPDSSDDGLTATGVPGPAPEPSDAGKPALESFPHYSDFENSANTKPQEVNSSEKSSQISESGASSGDFRQFANSLMSRPQDLTSLIDASSLFLHSERSAGEAVSPESSSRPPIPEQDTKPESTNAAPALTQTPHIIVVEPPKDLSLSPEKSYDSHSNSKVNLNRTFDSHQETEFPLSYDSHTEVMNIETINNEVENMPEVKVNGSVEREHLEDIVNKATDIVNASIETAEMKVQNNVKDLPNGSLSEDISTSTKDTITEVKCNGKSEKFAIVNFLSEPYEELLESNVDEESKDTKTPEKEEPLKDVSLENSNSCIEEVQEDSKQVKSSPDSAIENEVVNNETIKMNGSTEHPRVAAVTENFLQNEKQYCDLGSYLPLLSDIRFTGPASEIMSTSFSQESPTEPNPPECEQDTKADVVSEIVKEWDSDTESQSSNSSSGEFIWKDGDGRETALVPNTHFDHQRDGDNGGESTRAPDAPASGGDSASGSGSGSGSEGDEVEFVPSSWDCRAAPAKSALRTLQAHSYTLPQDKKRVVFKRQKYHCVYEYPREVADAEHSPAACLPDFSTYCDWDPRAAEEAALGYGQLFGSPLDMYPLPQGIAFGSDYDDDFFISSSARPFESLGIMSTTSQFFPGMHVKPMLERRLSDDAEEFPPPPPAALARPAPPSLPSLPSLDLTTPDSGVEDITPGSVADDDLKKVETTVWRGDSASSSESVSPSSPGGEALGGLRHTRDKLKLDLPPSPHVPSPRHSRVFSFALDKPRRVDPPGAPQEAAEPSEPTFSTFGKSGARGGDAEQKMILTDSDDGAEEPENPEPAEAPEAPEAPAAPAATKLGPASDSGDEDSGIESSSKATLERNKTPHVS